MTELSIIIPAYNEAKRIAPALQAINDFFSQARLDIEIILVNDGSTDATAAVARQVCPRIIIINQPKNIGKGAAVRLGIEASTKKHCLVIDADNSTPISEIKKFYPYLEDYQVIIGSRALDRSLVKIHQPWHKEWLGRLGNYLIQLFLVPGIKDTQCGFKLYAAATKPLWAMLISQRWAYDFEMLYLARKKRLNVKEVPIIWNNQPGSKVTAGDYLRTMIEIIKIKYHNYSR